MTYQETYRTYQSEIERYLAGLFLNQEDYHVLQDAMRYSLLAGGKRVRPVLTLAFSTLFGGQWRQAVPFACALELVHTYSLIHDDLPAMDNDDLRRGKPTCHKVYGEATAILAGDALQPEAFGILAGAEGLSHRQRVEAVAALAAACGGNGMVAGQILDLEGKTGGEEALRRLHSLKTGALIRCAAALGCIAADASPEQKNAAASYAENLGLVFQIRDDMLDELADERELGKPTGSDQRDGKCTFLTLLGAERCQELVRQYTNAAKAAVSGYPGCEFLLSLAEQMAERRA